MNGDGGGHLNQSGDVHTTHWFTRITDDPDFKAALEEPLGCSAEPTAPLLTPPAAARSTTMVESARPRPRPANDRALWQSYNPLGRYGPRASSYDGEISFVRTWYRTRYGWMNGQLE